MKIVYPWANTKLLLKMRNVIPFFNLIPNNIYFSLDTKSFFLPENSLIVARNELEENIDGYVMTYKRDTFSLDTPVSVHLCALLKGATLSRREEMLLKRWEDRYRDQNISFVIYQKPLLFVDYKKSLLYSYYLSHNLPLQGNVNIT